MPANSTEYSRRYYLSHLDVYKRKYNAKKHCTICDKWISGSNFADHLKTRSHLCKAVSQLAARSGTAPTATGTTKH